MYAGFFMALVLLSASVERVGVSRMRDFFILNSFRPNLSISVFFLLFDEPCYKIFCSPLSILP